jgi:thioredoxin
MDVTDSNFHEKVIEASKKRLIIVDFWADWCVPCNMLAPVLDKVVESFGDKVELVKVNVDQNPETSNKYNISAIPAVKLFKNGEKVDEFIGVQPEDSIKKMIDKNI